ncbi:hypothetical protein EVA_14746 [gut metagenome]|uniref:Uncharacterized protein n=1 Tax=gut metagenome TaxID=749906 RepID=J9G5T0_9ZZZZ
MHSSELTKCLSDFFKIIMLDVVRTVEFLIDIQELSSPILFLRKCASTRFMVYSLRMPPFI